MVWPGFVRMLRPGLHSAATDVHHTIHNQFCKMVTQKSCFDHAPFELSKKRQRSPRIAGAQASAYPMAGIKKMSASASYPEGCRPAPQPARITRETIHEADPVAQAVRGFGVVLAILAVLVAAALFSTDRLVESKTASQRSYDTVQRALELENQLANISIGIRGFMLTGKEDMLSAVYAGDGEVEKTLKTLRANLADQPEQLARLDKVSQLKGAWMGTAVSGH